jgi:1-acyl-sn-glycerol-3-phosphate acyltransferase
MASKKYPVKQVAPDIAILGDAVTIHPSGITESTVARKRENRDHSREVVSTMARFRQNPLEWVREVSLHVNGSGWRAYDKFVGQPMYFPGFTDVMKGRLMSNPMLQMKLSELASQRAQVEATEGTLPVKRGKVMTQDKRRVELIAELKEAAEKMVDGMICKMESKTFIKSAYYLVAQLLTRAYHQGIHVSSEEVIRLRAVAEKAAAKKQSIIFLPSHRSHVDYVSLQVLCFRLNLALPTVVAGDNLNFPVVGPFLQSAGAMWIRRSFGNDQLYSTVVQSYVDTLLQNGYNIECFIEGARSRTGKLLPPKFGILGFILDSLLSGRVEDAIICPVSTQYDKVIEVDSYITEMLGTPKQKESLAGFMSASSILNLNLGRIDVRFHEPWSLKEYVLDQFTRFTRLPPSMSNAETWTNERRIRLLRTLGYRVLSEINDVSVIMPTALIGTVLLTLRGRGVGKAELIRRVDWLCDRVHMKGGRVAHFGNLPSEIVVERGLEVLGPALVGRITSLPEETFHAVDR